MQDHCMHVSFVIFCRDFIPKVKFITLESILYSNILTLLKNLCFDGKEGGEN